MMPTIGKQTSSKFVYAHGCFSRAVVEVGVRWSNNTDKAEEA
jgi:hypothetical protein